MGEDEYRKRIEEVVDRFLQSRFGLWNALLTVNGLLLGILSASSFILDGRISITAKVIAVLCVLSLFLLVYCYISTMQTYYRIGEVLNDQGVNLDDMTRQKDISRSLWRRKLILLSERLAMILLLFEAVLVIYQVAES
jgi:hypothetical protein